MTSTAGFTKGPWRVETLKTSIGHCHKIQPLGACIYVDHRDMREKDDRTLTAAADAHLIARLANLYFAGNAERDGVDLDHGLTENEIAAARMMNALMDENERFRGAAQAIVREHENLEDRAPVEVECGDCNLGTGPHKRLCAYHAAKSALSKAVKP